MKHFALFILLLFSLNIFGQQKETTGKTFKRFQIGVSFSPDICYRSIKNHDGGAVLDTIIKNRKQNEIPRFGYHAGVDFCLNFTKWLSVQSGVQFSMKGYQLKFADMAPLQPDPILPEKLKFIYNFYYLDIPVKANFILGKGRVRFSSSLGMAVNVFLKETQTGIYIYSDGHSERKTDNTINDYKRVNLSVIASAGIDIKLINRMNLRIEPDFRYGVTNIIKAPVTGRLWDGGLNVGYYIGI